MVAERSIPKILIDSGYIPAKEAEEILCRKNATVLKLGKSGKVKIVKWGGYYFFEKRSCEIYMEKVLKLK